MLSLGLDGEVSLYDEELCRRGTELPSIEIEALGGVLSASLDLAKNQGEAQESSDEGEGRREAEHEKLTVMKAACFDLL